MAADKNKRPRGKSPEISSVDDLREDPLREESTDFRAPGEIFEIMPEGENLDFNMMDQPRHNLESLPKAHKDKARVPAGTHRGVIRHTGKKPKDRAA